MQGYDEDFGHQIYTNELTLSVEDGSVTDTQPQLQNKTNQSNMVPVPNQRNAFFASGFKMVDANNGNLEHIYQTDKTRRNKSMDEFIKERETNNQTMSTKGQMDGDNASSYIDRTGYILQSLKKSTPNTSLNSTQIKRIKQQAKSKVSYAYKERYSGVYEDRKRRGMLKRNDSYETFVNPPQIGLNNSIQHALHTETSEIRKLESK